jgi:bacterioferritin-associated ferredoxin
VYACICHAVTSEELDAVIAAGATDTAAVGEACGAGTGCGSCLDRLGDRCAHARRLELTLLRGGGPTAAKGGRGAEGAGTGHLPVGVAAVR